MNGTALLREDLRARQQDVLGHLLAGNLPPGFDRRSASLTSRVLVGKRRSEVREVIPELGVWPQFRERFAAWAFARPRTGCAHVDAASFLAELAGPLPEPVRSLRALERVYAGHAHFAIDRRAGQHRWVFGVGRSVWHLGPRRSPAK